LKQKKQEAKTKAKEAFGGFGKGGLFGDGDSKGNAEVGKGSIGKAVADDGADDADTRSSILLDGHEVFLNAKEGAAEEAKNKISGSIPIRKKRQQLGHVKSLADKAKDAEAAGAEEGAQEIEQALEKAADPVVHNSMGKALQYLNEHKEDPAVAALSERVGLDLAKSQWPVEAGSLGVNQVMMACVNANEWTESNANLLLGAGYKFEPW
jgi:hypothetical protein